jgi:hypothetical protein
MSEKSFESNWMRKLRSAQFIVVIYPSCKRKEAIGISIKNHLFKKDEG